MGEKIISKAAILTSIPNGLVVDEIELPDKLESGQVQVRVHVSGICGAQIREIAGAGGEDPYLPHLLGHEGGGIVERIGPSVTRVKEGDQVVMHWRKAPGLEADFPEYKWRDKTVGGGKVTTFNERSIVSENRLTPIGRKEGFDVPFEIAALMGCAVTTGLGIINNEAKVKIGESVAVIGCGGVGLIAILGAMMVSADQVIAIDIHKVKLKMASHFGATDTFNYPPAFGKYDVVIETTGLVGMIEKAYEMVAPGGRIILVGQPAYHQALILKEFRNYFKGITVMDSEGGQASPSMDIPRYTELFRDGKLKLDALVTHRYPLERIGEAIDTAKSGKAGRVILEML